MIRTLPLPRVDDDDDDDVVGVVAAAGVFSVLRTIRTTSLLAVKTPLLVSFAFHDTLSLFLYQFFFCSSFYSFNSQQSPNRRRDWKERRENREMSSSMRVGSIQWPFFSSKLEKWTENVDACGARSTLESTDDDSERRMTPPPPPSTEPLGEREMLHGPRAHTCFQTESWVLFLERYWLLLLSTTTARSYAQNRNKKWIPTRVRSHFVQCVEFFLSSPPFFFLLLVLFCQYYLVVF